MNNKSRFFCFVSIALEALGLSSCGSTPDDFRLFVYDQTDTFMASLSNDIVASFSGENWSFQTVYAARDQITQNEQIADALDNGVRLLIVNTVDRLTSSAIIEKCAKYGADVIFINREPLVDDMEGQTNAYYVGSDPENGGRLQGSLAEELFNKADLAALTCAYDRNKDGKIQIAIIRGELGHQDAEMRSKWCAQSLIDDGYSVEILTSITSDWTVEGGRAAMASIQKEYYNASDLAKDNVELLYCNNDDMAAGAVDSLTGTGVFQRSLDSSAQPIQIIGFDGTTRGDSLIVGGYMYGTVLNDASSQAKIVFSLADAILTGSDLSSFSQYTYAEGKKVTKSTLSA